MIAAFNAGIHECAHGLRYCLGKKGALNEIAAHYAQTTLGLPLKLDDKGISSSWFKQREIGVRDPIQPGTELWELWDEYLGALVVTFLKGKHAKGNNFDIFQYFSTEHQEEPSVGDIFADLFWYGKVSASDYSKRMGIGDQTTIKNIEVVFNGIQKVYKSLKKMKKTKDADLINAFIKEMKKQFGEPVGENIPEGFVMVYPNKTKEIRKVGHEGFMTDKA